MKRISFLAVACFPIAMQAQTPELIKHLAPGSLSTAYEQPIAYDGKLVFVLDSGISSVSPTQVWATDGTASGTQKVKEFAHLSLLSGFTMLNNKLYFVGNDGTHGNQLWVTDGTPDNTQI